MNKNPFNKRFRIHEGDVGTEAFEDRYVLKLEAENEKLRQQLEAKMDDAKHLLQRWHDDADNGFLDGADIELMVLTQEFLGEK